jgi:hypothetical protein
LYIIGGIHAVVMEKKQEVASKSDREIAIFVILHVSKAENVDGGSFC